jgi:hypothetical protein
VYVRSKVARGATYYQIVQATREGGRVRQRVVVALGKTSDPAAALEEMRRELDALKGAHPRRRWWSGRGKRRGEKRSRLERRIRVLSRILEEGSLEVTRGRSRARDRQAAIHEAGHAVLRFEEGGDAVGTVSIVPHAFSVGRVTVKARPPFSRRPPIDRELRFIVAGRLAEAIDRGETFEPDEWPISAGDMDYAEWFVADLGGWEKDERFCRAFRDADKTLRRPEVWVQVEALAARLVKDRTLTGREAKRLCRQARREFLARGGKPLAGATAL